MILNFNKIIYPIRLKLRLKYNLKYYSSIELNNKNQNENKIKSKQLVIIGTGWAGYKLFVELKHLRKKFENMMNHLDIIVVSERNHFLYTPLLASTTVGTLEFRSIIENVRGNHFRKENHFHLASVKNINNNTKEITCSSELDKREYNIKYDYLVIACGAKPNTFNIPGVYEYSYFLKEIWHARAIRTKILDNLELATQPGITKDKIEELLHFIVIGGGPTGVEFCAELYDFLKQDLKRLYPHVCSFLKVSLIDAGEVLGMFDKKLRDFALKKIQSRPNMKIIKQNCVEIEKNKVILSNGQSTPCGLIVWTAGIGPSDLTKSLPYNKTKNGNLLCNEFCQVKGIEESSIDYDVINPLPLKHFIFAIGDCCEIEKYRLPSTAQVAQSQAEYICSLISKLTINDVNTILPYTFQSKGMMAYIGGYEGLLQSGEKQLNVGDTKIITTAKWTGWKAWFLWRSAYLTKLGSWRLRMQVPMDWLKAMIVGRDVSRF